MINNFDLIKPLLDFQSEDEYYFLQILSRHKDNPEIPSKNSRNIKNYYIKSVKHLEDKMSEIIDLCEFFKARAYLRLTPRSYKVTAMYHLKQMAQMIGDGNYKRIAKSYLSSSGSTTSGRDKRWIIDIDDISNPRKIKDIKRYITELRPEGNKVLAEIPTKNGMHLITKPFDCSSFSKVLPEIEIHKDNPSILIIPNSIL